MGANAVGHYEIHRIREGSVSHIADNVAGEEPLSINIAFGKRGSKEFFPLSVTMRTPGKDELLALGFLFSEGVIQGFEDVEFIEYDREACRRFGHQNVLNVKLSEGLAFDPEKYKRNFYSSSSCGVCGKASLESVKTQIPGRLIHGQPKIPVNLITELPQKIRLSQQLFEHTGGIHACGLFDTKGELITLEEDIGRHNALDKVIGFALKKGLLPLHQNIVLLSGRAGFELVQKALMAGVPILASVGAPSSLAVDLARDNEMTLLGFVKETGCNIYSHEERIDF